jgi:hypothetical protein
MSERRRDSREPGTDTTSFGSGAASAPLGAGSFTTNAHGRTAFAPERAGPPPADPWTAEDDEGPPDAQAAARPAIADPSSTARAVRAIETIM